MKPNMPTHQAPLDAVARKAVAPVICYPVDGLARPDLAPFHAARAGWRRVSETVVPPRQARCFDVPAGHFFRITGVEGPQVGDLNLWAAQDLQSGSFPAKPALCTARICQRVIGCGRVCPICGPWR